MNSSSRGSDLLIIDFEACDIKDGSWPIEVGIGFQDEAGHWQTAGSLIKPEPHWPEEMWTPEAEAVHGISRSELDRAPSAREVADWLNEKVAGRTVASDFPRKDEPWYSMLLAAGDGDPQMYIADLCWDIFEPRFPEDVFFQFYAGTGPFAEDRPRVHRAEADVRHHIETWTMMEQLASAAQAIPKSAGTS